MAARKREVTNAGRGRRRGLGCGGMLLGLLLGVLLMSGAFGGLAALCGGVIDGACISGLVGVEQFDDNPYGIRAQAVPPVNFNDLVSWQDRVLPPVFGTFSRAALNYSQESDTELLFAAQYQHSGGQLLTLNLRRYGDLTAASAQLDTVTQTPGASVRANNPNVTPGFVILDLADGSARMAWQYETFVFDLTAPTRDLLAAFVTALVGSG